MQKLQRRREWSSVIWEGEIAGYDRQNLGSQETQLGHRSANGPRAMIGPNEILEEGCAHQTNREGHLKNYVRNHWNDGGLSVNCMEAIMIIRA
jgi:hypothetical protein